MEEEINLNQTLPLIHVIGQIQEPTGQTLTDTEGNEYPEYAPIDGYFIMSTYDYPILSDHKVVSEPTYPQFAGVQTYHYKFDDKQEWEEFRDLNLEELQKTHKEIIQEHDKRITKLAFLNRFTQAERILLRQAGKDNALVEDYWNLVSLATFIDLNRPDTISGVQTLESIGLLDEGRADEILNSPVLAEERYEG